MISVRKVWFAVGAEILIAAIVSFGFVHDSNSWVRFSSLVAGAGSVGVILWMWNR